MNNVRDLLEQIAATLTQMHAQDLKQTFLLQCCAITLGILWGALTWGLVCLSKNERDFL